MRYDISYVRRLFLFCVQIISKLPWHIGSLWCQGHTRMKTYRDDIPIFLYSLSLSLSPSREWEGTYSGL